MSPKKRKFIAALSGFLISILFVVLLLRSAPLIEIWEAVRQVNLLYILAAMIFAAISIMLRGKRWSNLFLPSHEIPWQSASSLVQIGLMINAILPGRVGDLARLGLAIKKFNAGVAFTSTTLVVERLMDGITLLVMLGISFLLLPELLTDQSVQVLGQTISSSLLIQIFKGLALICILLIVLCVIFMLPKGREFIYRISRKIPIVGRWLGNKEENIFHDIGKGLNALKSPKLLIQVIVYSGLIWGSLIVTNFIIAKGMAGINLSLLQIVVLTSVSIAVSSIPSAPGAWGVFEAGALLSISMLGVSYEQAVAIAYVFTIHVCQYIPVVLLGLFSVIKEHITIRKLPGIR